MDDDLIAYLEKKIKTLEAERDHWKSNHDNQVKLKHEITRRPSRFVEMVREIESLKKQLAASPHWVPVAEFNESNSESIVFGTILEYPANIHDAKLRGGVWRTSYGQVRVTHVLVGLNPPVSNEDPRGDGDVDYPITPDTDVALSVEQMSDAFDKMTEVTRKMNEPLEAIRARLSRPFLGSEAEKFGAKAVAKEYTAYTKAAVELDMAISDAERQAAGEKSELEQLRAENKKLRDALQELLDFSDVLHGTHYVRSLSARFNAGALLNPEAASENQKRD